MYILAKVRNADELANQQRDQDLLGNFIEDLTDYLLLEDSVV